MATFSEVFRQKTIDKNKLNHLKRLENKKDVRTVIPKGLLFNLHEWGIFHIASYDDRAIEVIKRFAQCKRYTTKTAKKYFYAMRSAGLFGDSNILIDETKYDSLNYNQTRVPNTKEFDAFLMSLEQYFHLYINKYTYRSHLKLSNNFLSKEQRNDVVIMDKLNVFCLIKFAYFTGLRLFEVCSLTNRHLVMLLNREKSLDIVRKGGVEWNVVYYKYFNELLDAMKNFYSKSIKSYMDYGVIVNLFDLKKRSVQLAIRQFYLDVNKKHAPFGFGIHTLRYMLATKIIMRGDIETARIMLGHTSTKTTKIYTKYDAMNAAQMLQEISLKDDFYRYLTSIF